MLPVLTLALPASRVSTGLAKATDATVEQTSTASSTLTSWRAPSQASGRCTDSPTITAASTAASSGEPTTSVLTRYDMTTASSILPPGRDMA